MCVFCEPQLKADFLGGVLFMNKTNFKIPQPTTDQKQSPFSVKNLNKEVTDHHDYYSIIIITLSPHNAGNVAEY